MRYIELFENSRASLYHSTGTEGARHIIRKNSVLPKTIQKIQKKKVPGVSLTRSWMFARNWNTIVFEFQQELLRRDFKIVPFNWSYVEDGPSIEPYHQRNESEEFLIGELHNIEKYLIAIWVPEKYTKLEVVMFGGKPHTFDHPGTEPMQTVLSHPKMKTFAPKATRSRLNHNGLI